MDAFFAAVEIRDDPSLRGKPLIIGSMPNERGVVATASYEAREYGIHSAMNIKEAFRLCPNGIYMHPHMEKYKTVSRQLHEIWNCYSTALEAVAYDEAYLDVTAQASNFEGARRIGHEIKQRIRDELGLSCSVGVAYSKTAAKTASEENKPNGYFEIFTQKDYVDLIIDRDVRSLYTVGAKTARKLYSSGIRTVRDIQEQQELVIRLLGKQGQWITRLACGIDDRRVTPYRPEDAKSLGREVTFQKDVNDYAFVRDVLLLLAVCVYMRAKNIGLHGKGVSLKLTYADMKQITRSQAVFSTDSPVDIFQNALLLLEQVEQLPIRLIGTGIYNLSDEADRQLSFDDMLEDSSLQKERMLKDLLDDLKGKYGLEFAGNLEQIYQADTLHKTIEYMRRHL